MAVVERVNEPTQHLVHAGHLHHAVHVHLHHVLLDRQRLTGLQDGDVFHPIGDFQELLQRQLHLGSGRVERIDTHQAAHFPQKLLQQVQSFRDHRPDLSHVEALGGELDPTDGWPDAHQRIPELVELSKPPPNVPFRPALDVHHPDHVHDVVFVFFCTNQPDGHGGSEIARAYRHVTLSPTVTTGGVLLVLQMSVSSAATARRACQPSVQLPQSDALRDEPAVPLHHPLLQAVHRLRHVHRPLIPDDRLIEQHLCELVVAGSTILFFVPLGSGDRVFPGEVEGHIQSG